MGILEKVKQMVGGAKEKIGDATGIDGLAESGKAEQVEAEATEAGQNLKDKASDTMNDGMNDGKDKLDS